MNIKTYANSEKLSKAAAQFFVEQVGKAVDKRGKFTVALSGGGTPQQMYKLLASGEFKHQVPWEDVYVFWGDERFVPSDDPENNAQMAKKLMLDHVPVPSNQIFPIPTDGKPEDAADRYTETLKRIFGDDDFPRFDFMLMGLGTNGHTASLFPHTRVLHERQKWTEALFVEEEDQYRITLTAPVINNARDIVFMAYGEAKAETVTSVIEGPKNVEELPAQLITPADGNLYWLLDEAAAAKLSQKNISS